MINFSSLTVPSKLASSLTRFINEPNQTKLIIRISNQLAPFIINFPQSVPETRLLDAQRKVARLGR